MCLAFNFCGLQNKPSFDIKYTKNIGLKQDKNINKQKKSKRIRKTFNIEFLDYYL